MSFPIGNLFSIIKQIPEEYSPEIQCPFCGSDRVSNYGTMQTLVGGGSSIPGDESNPNHYSEDNHCSACQKRFSKQYKGNSQWYQDYNNNGRVIRGFHMCFESCTYDCISCGGEVSRKYTKLDGVSETHSLGQSQVNGKWVKDYRIFWSCNGCPNGVEIE